MKQLNATKKGLATGGVMILLSMLFASLHALDSPSMYLTYITYAGGIIWTLVPFSLTEKNEGKFSGFFSEGFKCFVIVTLMMVIFWWAFYKLHPEIIEQIVISGSKQMQQQGNSTPAEINEKAAQVRKSALTIITSANIIKYLILGALFTALSSLLILKRKK